MIAVCRDIHSILIVPLQSCLPSLVWTVLAHGKTRRPCSYFLFVGLFVLGNVTKLRASADSCQSITGTFLVNEDSSAEALSLVTNFVNVNVLRLNLIRLETGGRQR